MLGLLRAQHTYQVPILGDRFLKMILGALVSKNIFSKVFGLFPEAFSGKILESWQSYILQEIHFWEFITCIDLAKGKIRDKNTQARLSSYDCFFIANSHIMGKKPLTLFGGSGVMDYAIAIEWVEAAME